MSASCRGTGVLNQPTGSNQPFQQRQPERAVTVLLRGACVEVHVLSWMTTSYPVDCELC